MFKVSVMYPATPGVSFDHDYYRDKHMPLVASRLGDVCKSYDVDRGVSGREDGSPPPFVAMCHIYCEDLAAFARALAEHGPEIDGDVARYTQITPITQISAVVD